MHEWIRDGKVLGMIPTLIGKSMESRRVKNCFLQIALVYRAHEKIVLRQKHSR